MKKKIAILLCAGILSSMFALASCDEIEEGGNNTEASTESESVYAESDTIYLTTEKATTAEVTTEEVTTAENTTEKITTAETATAEVTTEEITTEEVTTEEETLDELSAAIKECNDILVDSQMISYAMLVYYDELMGNRSTISDLVTYNNLFSRYNNYKKAVATYEANLEYAQYKDSDDNHHLYLKYEKSLLNKNSTLQDYLTYMQLFGNQEVECKGSRILKVKDILSMAEELDSRIYNAHNFIEIIAKYEGVTIAYADAESKNVFNIVDIDNYTYMTESAIVSVIAAYNNIHSASFSKNMDSIKHDTGYQGLNFLAYDENGNIPDPNVREAYYVLRDDGVIHDANGNDISEKDIAFTGTSVSNYRYFEILDVSSSAFKGDGTNGTVSNKWYYTLTLNGVEVTVQVVNYDGGRVVFVPIVEEQVTDNIYRNIRITGEWCYYSKDADGNIADYYLRLEDGSYTKVTAVEYDGNVVSPEGVTVKVLKNENGEIITDINGNTIYVSGTDHNNFTMYKIEISAVEKYYEIKESLDKLINDVAAFGDITAEELSELVYNTDISL